MRHNILDFEINRDPNNLELCGLVEKAEDDVERLHTVGTEAECLAELDKLCR